MRKVGIVVIVAVLAVAGVMAALAYSSATVENDFSLAVVTTNDALLALEPGNHNAAYITDGGELAIDLSRGLNNEKFGLNKRSEYKWSELFAVKNNSENAVGVVIDLDGFEWIPGLKVFARVSGSGGWKEISAGLQRLTFNLNSGEEQYIDVKVVVPRGVHRNTYFGTLVVSAEAITIAE
jgi:hypothetical protein